MRKPDQQLTRRTLLGSVGAATIASSLPTQAGVGREGVPALRRAFVAEVKTAPVSIGKQSGLVRHMWVTGGVVRGSLLEGQIQSGRLEWQMAAGQSGVELLAEFVVRRADGSTVEVRDRALGTVTNEGAELSLLASRPELRDALGASPVTLVGRMDASACMAGTVRLNAFMVD